MQEENRILERTNRQKVLEVEKLSQTIQELEEAILAGGAAANAILDYKRQIDELHVCMLQLIVMIDWQDFTEPACFFEDSDIWEIDQNAPSTNLVFILNAQDEKKTLERELARVKVSANRVATVVANEWKDENDKVMPVKQWLEDRRLMQVFLIYSVQRQLQNSPLLIHSFQSNSKHLYACVGRDATYEGEASNLG